MKFELDDDETQKIDEWKESLPSLKDGEGDVSGGNFTYKFTPTGLGTFIEVERIDKQSLKLYDRLA